MDLKYPGKNKRRNIIMAKRRGRKAAPVVNNQEVETAENTAVAEAVAQAEASDEIVKTTGASEGEASVEQAPEEAAAEPVKKTRRGRKPKEPKAAEDGQKKRSSRMSIKEKAERAKAKAEEKKKADSMKPAVLIQYQNTEINVDALVEAAKDDFKGDRKRAPRVTSMRLYIKPEEYTAYYVINEEAEGKISF